MHFQALDTMYWSVVDIVDTIVAEAGSAQLMTNASFLKDDLYTVLRYNLDHTVDLFRRYSYPNVGKIRRRAFVRELQDLLEARRDLLPRFNFQMLKGLLQTAEGVDSLPFLEDEAPNVLIDEFGAFYIKRLGLFKNSTHILDIEEALEARLAAETFVDNGRMLRNYRFVDSKQEAGIQIADAVVGLLGKCFTFMNRTPLAELRDARSRFTPLQSRNLVLLANIVDRSTAENATFASYVLSTEDPRRCIFLLEC